MKCIDQIEYIRFNCKTACYLGNTVSMKTLSQSLMGFITVLFFIVSFAEAKGEKATPSLIMKTANEAYATFETEALNNSKFTPSSFARTAFKSSTFAVSPHL